VKPCTSSGGFFDWDASLARLDQLNAQAADSSLWEDPTQAQKIMQERSTLEEELRRFKAYTQELEDALALLEMAIEEKDDTSVHEAETLLQDLAKRIDAYQLENLLSGEADTNDCYLEIHAGAGGTEAQDWAEMLSRLYTRWAEAHRYKVEIFEESPGEEAGLKSITLKIAGFRAYGWLKTESGVHRLVRISPFDANARRHTSFASVWVYPAIDDAIHVTIEEKDLRIDTYRASGAGGQHVNKTESAIRITHIPSGIVVQCQTDRSQHRNRAVAMDMLRSRLYELELRKKEKALADQAANKSEIGWGHQIRSYVLQPYQMVKDLRTGVEKSNAQAVLDGDIDAFLQASLSLKLDNITS
jgi:peptide chain release factor 2